MFLKIKHFKRDFNKWTLLIVALSLFLAIPIFSILISLFRGNGEMWEHITSYFLFDYKGSSPINISSGTTTTIKYLADTIAKLTNYSGDLIWDDSYPDGQMIKIFSVEK